MLTWEVIATLAGLLLTLLGIIAFFVKPLLKLNTSITTLSEAVKNLLNSIEKNDKCHDKFTSEIADHETRISIIEDWRQGSD